MEGIRFAPTCRVHARTQNSRRHRGPTFAELHHMSGLMGQDHPDVRRIIRKVVAAQQQCLASLVKSAEKPLGTVFGHQSLDARRLIRRNRCRCAPSWRPEQDAPAKPRGQRRRRIQTNRDTPGSAALVSLVSKEGVHRLGCTELLQISALHHALDCGHFFLK